MLYADILRTLGGMAILVAALAWLSKTLLTAFLSKDLERFKSDLQASSQISIESYKASLQLEAQRHAVTYSALHSKRAELVAVDFTNFNKLFAITLHGLHHTAVSFESVYSRKNKLFHLFRLYTLTA